MDHNGFWRGWFGLWGREIGDPSRRFTDNTFVFLRFIEECTVAGKPCFMSVQPYRRRDVVFGLEKLFFDFDCKDEPPDLDAVFSDVQCFATCLRAAFNVEPLIIVTRRGFHVYVFLWSIVEFKPGHERIAKTVYKRLQDRVIGGHSYRFLDSTCIGDLKRLARVPYSLHESGVKCVPVDIDRQPVNIEDLATYRRRGIREALFREVIQEASERLKIEEMFRVFNGLKEGPLYSVRRRGLRPCFVDALKAGIMPHGQRMALVYEAYCAGMSREDIVNLYRSLHDFDEAKTRYQVNWLLERKGRGKIKPYKCRTIERKGWCLKEKCPMYK